MKQIDTKDNFRLTSALCMCVSHSVVSSSLQPYGLVVQLCLIFCDPMEPTRPLCLWNSPGKNTGVGSLSLLQGIFPAQGSNPGLLHCRQILYRLSQQGSPASAIKEIKQGEVVERWE